MKVVAFLSMLSLALAEDLMAVCFSFTSVDMCTPDTSSRTLLSKQGTQEKEHRRLGMKCGEFCAGWDTFCSEYMCDADTMGMTCEEIVAEAKEHMQTIASNVGTEACMKQMDPKILECICMDQDN